MQMKDGYGKRKKVFYKFGIVATFACLILAPAAQAAMTGLCVTCHTMHNSQDGQPMNFDESTTPNENLTRGDCFGCHAQGKNNTIEGNIPQVYHTDTNDLAGGNFAYINGTKGSGASDRKGHNIGPLTGIDAVLEGPPGGIDAVGHDRIVLTTEFTCAGTNGCHGYRSADADRPEGITGSHHKNANGKIDIATEPGNSYRFLNGVKGFESTDWEDSPSPILHNEYFALAAPVSLGCSAISCHTSDGIKPPDGTMSQYCATCHGDFHTLASDGVHGVGTDAASPFIRHPSDLALPSEGEYASYITYSIGSPVARTILPDVASGTVNPGTDAVMCLSCHVTHASNFASMLRWDYSDMVAGGGGADTGCFVCHSTKN
jgi:Doubled CXXCH motif (Paired_CXXCH_1)